MALLTARLLVFSALLTTTWLPPTTALREGGRLHGLAYSPYDTSPGWCKPANVVASDLVQLKRITKRIRLFAINPCPGLIAQILSFAQDNDMTVLLGIWMGTDVCAAYGEINALPSLLAAYSKAIEAVMVGNEVFHSNLATVPQMEEYITATRAIVKSYNVALGSVDTKDSWYRADVRSRLAPLLDVIGVNAHPYFEYVKPSDAANSIVASVDSLCSSMKLRPNQRCILSETGWPTAGSDHSPATPSPAGLMTYLKGLLAKTDARAKPMEYYWFEVEDAAWKRANLPCYSDVPAVCEAEYSWGLLQADGSAKNGVDIMGLIAARAAQP